MSNYTNKELIADLAAETGLTKHKAQEVVDGLVNIIRSRADAGKKVSLAGFGKFEMRERAARQGRNPATGEAVQIEAKRSLAFKPSKAAA